MPRREILKLLRLRKFTEDTELHLPVAHHIRIRSHPVTVAREKVIDDPVMILIHQAEDTKLNPEVVTDGPGVTNILLPRAVPRQVFFIREVLHVSAHDLVPLLKKQGCSNRGVDSSRHGG